ncbi:alpha-D-ribose 1-methylphosphonate 5-triphosphate diphosphatase [Stutzerimonas azotifigens]|uniref:Alpha-D-ribose 1-methylphosphonate 5-triphosphate diphosphatase n=1 Tax=Stutzerimonas azotifigens TaxID=291995 RepID=A0ABR5YZN9_9GAMM|nr:alpha-D-ribose 1-methylphosphonate 5-triphosphate diphosphatase [Stutzerimonas azotifigens]MBA1273355.1 alpha-D-ribose 1-methylphosphonate 5-triphosphate diphosphatase [Stutzerimonas azotifigens]
MSRFPVPGSAGLNSFVIENIRVLMPEGWSEPTSVSVADGRIQAIGAAPQAGSARIEGQGGYLLPGIIDLHGDAFERHITPRAGTQFPLELALAANDASLVANGITTFFYSITDGFEPGPRSRETVRGLLDALERLMPRFACQARVHIRHEKVNTDDHDELLGWLTSGRVHLLSLNDHLPPMDDARKVQRYLAGLKRRVSMPDDEVEGFLQRLQANRVLGERQSAELAAAAHRYGVALASHDDETLEDVSRARDLGVSIAEFPMCEHTARASQQAGAAVLMGAPNLVRGGSHVGAIGVREAIEQGLVDVLCSDYHYPSLYRAAFTVAELGLLPLAQAWKLVSENPARAAGLGERKGCIAPGYDADLLWLSELDGSPLSLQTTWVGGVAVYSRQGNVLQTGAVARPAAAAAQPA